MSSGETSGATQFARLLASVSDVCGRVQLALSSKYSAGQKAAGGKSAEVIGVLKEACYLLVFTLSGW